MKAAEKNYLLQLTIPLGAGYKITTLGEFVPNTICIVTPNQVQYTAGMYYFDLYRIITNLILVLSYNIHIKIIIVYPDMTSSLL